MDFKRYPPTLNAHYDFTDPDNLAEILLTEAYGRAFQEKDIHTLALAERRALNGRNGYAIGVDVAPPWGENKVIDVKKDQNGDVVECIKLITLKPGAMLSLQRHLGRAELWEVEHGILTVVKDGELLELPAGQTLSLQPGSVHCMSNTHAAPTIVRETQTGLCYEADNTRLIDANGRPTYPLTTENELKSAQIYVQLHQTISGNMDKEALKYAS